MILKKELTIYYGDTQAPPKVLRPFLNKRVTVFTEVGEIKGLLAGFDYTWSHTGIGNLILINDGKWTIIKDWECVKIE